MTDLARAARDFRHANEKEVMTAFSRIRAGQFSTFAQVKAAARKVLRNHTARLMRES